MIIHAGSKSFNPRTVSSEHWSIARYVLGTLLFIGILIRFSTQPFLPRSQAPVPDPYAYVFYATADPYACSALVNAIHLQTTLNVTHPIYLLATTELSDDYITLFRSHGVHVIISPPPPLTDGGIGYYADSLLKMMAFGLYNYVPHLKRVIIMDSDQLVLRNLDHLFDLPSVPLAAPRAYWIDGKGPGEHPATSALMLIEQSPKTWAMVERGLRSIASDKYDMDLMADLFADTLLMLPGYYCTLNAHWDVWDLPTWYTGHGGGPEKIPNYEWKWEATDDTMLDLWEKVMVLHFTAMGKPWNSMLLMDAGVVSPISHWLFGRQFEMWRLGVNGGKPSNDSDPSGAQGPVFGADQVCLGNIWSGYSKVPEGVEMPGPPKAMGHGGYGQFPLEWESPNEYGEPQEPGAQQQVFEPPDVIPKPIEHDDGTHGKDLKNMGVKVEVVVASVAEVVEATATTNSIAPSSTGLLLPALTGGPKIPSFDEDGLLLPTGLA